MIQEQIEREEKKILAVNSSCKITKFVVIIINTYLNFFSLFFYFCNYLDVISTNLKQRFNQLIFESVSASLCVWVYVFSKQKFDDLYVLIKWIIIIIIIDLLLNKYKDGRLINRNKTIKFLPSLAYSLCIYIKLY